MARHTSPAQMETPIPRLAKASTISDESKTGEKPERLGASGVLGALGRGPFIVYKDTQKGLKGDPSNNRRPLHSRPMHAPNRPNAMSIPMAYACAFALGCGGNPTAPPDEPSSAGAACDTRSAGTSMSVGAGGAAANAGAGTPGGAGAGRTKGTRRSSAAAGGGGP